MVSAFLLPFFSKVCVFTIMWDSSRERTNEQTNKQISERTSEGVSK